MERNKPNLQFINNDTKEIIFERFFNPSQLKFWNSEAKYTVFNGGFGSGKTEPLILKAIVSAMQNPDNYILMGRKTYQEIYDVLWKDFITLCPAQFIKDMKKSPHPSVELYCPGTDKTSTIIFRNLDKMAETEIKGLNLGEIYIDQAEDTPEDVFQALTFRLRRRGCPLRIWMTVNPALNWIYQRAKGSRKEGGWEVIEAPSTENYHNLPTETVEIYESYKTSDPAYYKQYVLGVWDESLLAENTVFAREHLDKLQNTIETAESTYEGLQIYRTFSIGHKYQMGIDCAEGLEHGDRASITISDLTTLEVAAHWAEKLPPDVVAEKAVDFARIYSDENKGQYCLLVPEMNSMGLALLQKLKDLGWERIYQREEYDKRTNKKMKKLGWRTTTQTKPLMVSNFRHLLRNFDIRIHNKETYQELKSFVYSDEAAMKGMGALVGYHDDRVISLLLSFWENTRRDPKAEIVRTEKKVSPLQGIGFVPSVTIKNGQVRVLNIPKNEKQIDWKIG